MNLPKPFFLCLIQTTPFLKRTFQFQFFRISHQRPKTKSKADSIAQEPTKKHPSITKSKNLPRLFLHLFSNPSGIYFQNAWQKATCHRTFMAKTKIHSKVQTIHQWSSVQQFLTCMNFDHGCRLWLPSEKPVQSSWCWDLSTNPQMTCPSGKSKTEGSLSEANLVKST